jgi:hypothetical protein
MSGGKKQQKHRRDSIKDWRFQVLPPERSLRQLTTPLNPVWRLRPFRVVYGALGSEVLLHISGNPTYRDLG